MQRIRLARDLKQLEEHHTTKRLIHVSDSILTLELESPPSTPYYPNPIILTIDHSPYPLRQPTIKFAKPLLHTGVDPKTQEICHESLPEWKPSNTLLDLSIQIQSFLATPLSASPLNPEYAKLMSISPDRAFKLAQDHYSK